MDREWQVEGSWLYSRHQHSPFIGWKMKGWIAHLLLRGRTIARDGEVVAGSGGMWLRRQVPAEAWGRNG